MASYNSYIAQDLIRVADVLRDEFLPFLKNGINTEADPFLEVIKKGTLSANSGRYGARIGIGGGFGMSAERQPTPNAVAPLYEDLVYISKDAYVDIKLSHKDVTLARNTTGALVDTVADAMDASYEAAKWNVGRMLFGDGTGKLATVTAASTGTYKGVTVTELTVDDTSKLIEGLVIDTYTGTTLDNSTLQIVSVDHGTKKILLNTQATTAIAANDILYVQGSKDREITGLGAIFADASAVPTIYGVAKASNAWINPSVVDADHDISDVVITDAIRMAGRRNGKIDMILAGSAAFNAYEYYMRESGINTNIIENRKFRAGAAGYDILFGDRIATLVRNDFVPTNEMWGVDTKQFELRQTDWDFVDYQGSPFVLMPDTSVYRALLANYMELICKNPGTCVRITNANAST